MKIKSGTGKCVLVVGLISLLVSVCVNVPHAAASPQSSAHESGINPPGSGDNWRPPLPELLCPAILPPTLSDAKAQELQLLEGRIAELTRVGLNAPSREEQDRALDSALVAAQQALAIRLEHQGNSADIVRWRDVSGKPREWYEVGDARRTIDHLQRLRILNSAARHELAAQASADVELERLYDARQFAEALPIAEGIRNVRQRVLGNDAPETLTSIHNVGVMLENLNQPRQAAEQYRQAMDGRDRVLGRDHPHTTPSRTKLGIVRFAYADYEGAIECFQELLVLHTHAFGPDHRKTLDMVAHVGVALEKQGHPRRAEPYFRYAYSQSRTLFGPADPFTLRTLGNYGYLLMALGKMKEAAPYYWAAVEQKRLHLGNEHPDTLVAITNLGCLLHMQGKLIEAEPLYREALDVGRRVLGEDHPHTLTFSNNMGSLLKELGRYAEAERFLREALDASRRISGNSNPNTLTFMSNVAGLLREVGRLDESEIYSRDALKYSRQTRGDADPLTLSLANNLAILLDSQGKLAESEQLFREAMQGRKNLYGADHPDVINSTTNVGLLVLAQGNAAAAETYLREALAAARRTHGMDHPDTLVVLRGLGRTIREQNRLLEAESIYREVFDRRTRVLGEGHLDTIAAQASMASIYREQGRLEEAELHYRAALANAEQLRQEISNDPSARADLGGVVNLSGVAAGLARVLTQIGRDSEAFQVLERGRCRAALDLFAGNTEAAMSTIETSGDEKRMARYGVAIAGERDARSALLEAQLRLVSIRKEHDAASNMATGDRPGSANADTVEAMLVAGIETTKMRQRELNESTAAVFGELRGLFPSGKPLSTEQILNGLKPGEVILNWSWLDEGVIVLVAQANAVRAVTVAKNEDEVIKLVSCLRAFMREVALRPAGTGQKMDQMVLQAARDALIPIELREKIREAKSIFVAPDGPLYDVPFELLIDDVQIAYEPSATIAIEQRSAAHPPPSPKWHAVVLGDPDFGDNEQIKAIGPDVGLLVLSVTNNGNAAAAGIQRGDVLLRYAETPLISGANLQSAVGTARPVSPATDNPTDRPITVSLWRMGKDGLPQSMEVKVACGPLDAQFDQRPPSIGLHSIEFFDRSPELQKADAVASDEVRLFGRQLPPLPGTRIEASAVAAIIGPQALLLMGSDASVTKLRDSVFPSVPRFILLATHGIVGRSSRPLEASLALTRPKEFTVDDIGFLTLEEILDRWVGKLKGCELVTLSACDTASGRDKGDTVMSLPLGFLVAGAETVVASLWKVDDTATALLMSRFHANLLGKCTMAREVDGVPYPPGAPLPKLAALREARDWLRSVTAADRDRLTKATPNQIVEWTTRGGVVALHGASADSSPSPDAHPFDHPYYWSGFVLYGSPE